MRQGWHCWYSACCSWAHPGAHRPSRGQCRRSGLRGRTSSDHARTSRQKVSARRCKGSPGLRWPASALRLDLARFAASRGWHSIRQHPLSACAGAGESRVSNKTFRCVEGTPCGRFSANPGPRPGHEMRMHQWPLATLRISFGGGGNAAWGRNQALSPCASAEGPGGLQRTPATRPARRRPNLHRRSRVVSPPGPRDHQGS